MATTSTRYSTHDKLGAGGMGTVYRATDRLTGNIVALKQVTTRAEDLEFASHTGDSVTPHLALGQEFKTLASLRHPHIISVLDYGFGDGVQPFFTMSYLEGGQPLVEASEGQSLETKVDYLIQMLQALAYLHRRNVIHRDLKPGNVLVADGIVKVLDFGLSLRHTESMQSVEKSTGGTFAYMAPEVLSGKPATRAADLYAVGVMAYEMFAGHHPFNIDNIAGLIMDVMTTTPDMDFLDIGFDLAEVIERLLARSQDDRYQDANRVIRDLCAAVDQPLPAETVEIRESFLQAAKLVGRRPQLDQLLDVLKTASARRGSIWLIGGESGVGKTRLLDELRVRALVRGALVLRGQAISEGSNTYHLWRGILRLLVLHTDITDDEASILKAAVPDIGVLLDREVADAPPLPETPQVQYRLFMTLAGIFKRQTRPILILMEDLQWIGTDSLALINHLAKSISTMPLLLLGDYRDDERPDLPQNIPSAQVLKLDRLDETGITELSVSMLGESGSRPQVVDLLQRETEGNAFFLVEVVRALAEEAGQLEQIGMMTLPERVFAGGVQAVVERRLNHVSEDARALLRLAAIEGRQLDLNVLQALAPDADLEEWLTLCTEAAILEAQNENWQFAHHKLRECLVEDMPEDQRPNLYRQVAEAIENAHPDDAEQAATLAHLWKVAGDTDKERHYATQAGMQAFQQSADVEAGEYFSRALDLVELLPEGQKRAQQELDIRVPYSVVLMHTRGLAAPEVEQSWVQSRQLCNVLGTPPQLESVLWGLCGLYMAQGNHELSKGLDHEIIKIAPLTAQPNLTYLQAHYTSAVNLLALGEVVEALHETEKAMAYYSPDDSQQSIATYGQDTGISVPMLSISILQILGYSDQARAKFDETLAAARALEHPFTLSVVLTFSLLYQMQRNVEMTYTIASESFDLAEKYGYGFHQIMTMPVLGWALTKRGQVDDGIEMMSNALSAIQGMGSAFFLNYFSGLLVDSYLGLGLVEEGLSVVDKALARVDSSGDRFYEPELHRLKGELLLAQGADQTQIEEYYQRALEISREREVKWLELRATMSLSQLWQSQGKIDEAREALSEIYGWFTEGFDTVDLQEAKALVDELS